MYQGTGHTTAVLLCGKQREANSPWLAWPHSWHQGSARQGISVRDGLLRTQRQNVKTATKSKLSSLSLERRKLWSFIGKSDGTSSRDVPPVYLCTDHCLSLSPSLLCLSLSVCVSLSPSGQAGHLASPESCVLDTCCINVL